MNKRKAMPKIGLRTTKTALACLILGIIYIYLLKRNPCFALIGAAFSCGSQFNEGFRHGFNRSIGTLTGGVVILLLYHIYWTNPLNILPEIYMAIGVVLLLYFNTILGSSGAIQPAIVIYFVVMYTQPEDNYAAYTIARIIDTAIGAAFGCLFNYLLPSKIDRQKKSNLSTAYHAWVKASKRSKEETLDFYEADMIPRNDNDTLLR